MNSKFSIYSFGLCAAMSLTACEAKAPDTTEVIIVPDDGPVNEAPEPAPKGDEQPR